MLEVKCWERLTLRKTDDVKPRSRSCIFVLNAELKKKKTNKKAQTCKGLHSGSVVRSRLNVNMAYGRASSRLLQGEHHK